MNKKGFTVVELIAAFTLTMVISVFLFEILIESKDIFIETTLKTSIQEKTSIISKNIRMKIPKGVTSTVVCSTNTCTINGNNLINIVATPSNDEVEDYIVIGSQKIKLPKDGTKPMKIKNISLSASNGILKISFTLNSINLTKPYEYNVVFYYRAS